ncbi:MAG: glycosyltransferase family 87 protein [Gemmataceae bacterium]
MPDRWYTSPWFRRVTLALGGLFLVGFGVDAVLFKDNDFLWHWVAGHRYLAGDVERMRGEWYLLGRFLFNGLIALAPYFVARGLTLLAAVCGLAASVQMMRQMAGATMPLDDRRAYAVAAFSFLLLAPHFSRDLQECGLHILFLTMLVAAGYFLWCGRSLAAGAWLGVAICYKTTALLFLPVLVWKRRWTAAAATVVAVVALNLLPTIHLGWDASAFCHRRCWDCFRASSAADIAHNPVEGPNPKNQGLMPAFARYLQTFPPGHPLYQEHPAFVQFGNLDAAAAKRVAKSCLLLIAAFVAWRMWGAWSPRAADLPWQWGATAIFAALLSPMCWRQHLIAAWPILYLMLWSLLRQAEAPRWRWALLLGSAALLWLPQREVMGRDLSLLFMNMKVDTLVFLGWSVAALLHRPPSSAAPSLGRVEDGLPAECSAAA